MYSRVTPVVTSHIRTCDTSCALNQVVNVTLILIAYASAHRTAVDKPYRLRSTLVNTSSFKAVDVWSLAVPPVTQFLWTCGHYQCARVLPRRKTVTAFNLVLSGY